MHSGILADKNRQLLPMLFLGLLSLAGCGSEEGGSAVGQQSAVEQQMRAAIQTQIDAHHKLASIYDECNTDAEFEERSQDIQQELVAAEERANELDEEITDEEKNRIKEDKLIDKLHGAKMKRAEARYDFRVRKTER